jgi:hypothetical protein
MLEWPMNNELERMWKEGGMTYYPNICLEILKKTMKNLSQDTWWLNWDLNQIPPEYTSEVLPLELTCLMYNKERYRYLR